MSITMMQKYKKKNNDKSIENILTDRKIIEIRRKYYVNYTILSWQKVMYVFDTTALMYELLAQNKEK